MCVSIDEALIQNVFLHYMLQTSYGKKYCPTLEAYFDEKHIIKNISQEGCLRIDSVKKALTRTLIQAKNRFKKHCENRMCVQG